MSVDNIIRSRKRYASNVMWMTALMYYIHTKKKGFGKLSESPVNSWFRTLEKYFKLSASKAVLKRTQNHELIAFREIACDSETATFKPEKLQQQIDFEIKCMPTGIKELTKLKPASKDAQDYQPDLNAILTIMYLTRKAVAIAESVCVEKGDKKFLSNDTSKLYAGLLCLCTRIRSSTFSTLAPQIEEEVDENTILKYSKEMSGFYETWGKKAGAPFFGKRRYRTKGATQLHRDDPILNSWAGTHSVPVDTEKSVLGMVERVYNLPERCDISGTTTDTLGFALYDFENAGVDIDSIQDPDLFAFTNIYGMILSGHHSLFETNAAASLWSKKYYPPFEPLGIFIVLSNMFTAQGKSGGKPLQLSEYAEELKKIVYKSKPDTEVEKTMAPLYQYTIELWRNLAGMMVPGDFDKALSWHSELEISQTLYVMAEKLCSLAHGLEFK